MMQQTVYRFLECLPFTLAQECPHPTDWSNPANYSNDKHDPGGKTMCGIIQREYDAWRKSNGMSTRDVRQMTQAEGEAIYLANYWNPHCPTLPIGLDMEYFDAAVNMGTTEATKIMQVALGIANDGEWGPLTDAAVAGITDVATVIKAFETRRGAVYQEMTGFQYFGDDWMRRCSEIGTDAAKMCA